MLLLIKEELHTQFFFSFPEGLFQNEPFDWPTTNLFGTWGTQSDKHNIFYLLQK
jgi:hypothetical protein